MSPTGSLSLDLVRAAEEVVRNTTDCHELRQAQSILLAAVFCLNATGVGRIIGRSEEAVAQLQGEFRALHGKQGISAGTASKAD